MRRAGSPGGIARMGRAINDVNSRWASCGAEGGVCRIVRAATIRAAASELDRTEIQAAGLSALGSAAHQPSSQYAISYANAPMTHTARPPHRMPSSSIVLARSTKCLSTRWAIVCFRLAPTCNSEADEELSPQQQTRVATCAWLTRAFMRPLREFPAHPRTEWTGAVA
jgi:hypothetical protein